MSPHRRKKKKSKKYSSQTSYRTRLYAYRDLAFLFMQYTDKADQYIPDELKVWFKEQLTSSMNEVYLLDLIKLEEGKLLDYEKALEVID